VSLLAFVLLLTGSASAALPEAVVREVVAARAGVALADVEVGPLGLPASALVDGAWQVSLPSNAVFTGATTMTLSNGPARFVVRPRVVVWREVPVAASAVSAGSPVEVGSARVASDVLRGEVPVDPSLAWDATVSFTAGQPVTMNRVRPRADVREGAAVRIEAGVGPLSVSAPGELLSDARVGQRVAVLNLATRAVQDGVYRGENVVALEAP
jgi:flagella basal body P-ring formation protein FlgA